MGGGRHCGGCPHHSGTCCKNFCLGCCYGTGHRRSLCQGCERLGHPDREGDTGEGIKSGGREHHSISLFLQ
jgi:hypothetical protein